MPMNPRLLVPRATFDPDAAAYLRAVEAADGQALETPVKRAVDDFFRGTKADGTFSALKAACLLCGARTLAGALVPLVGAAPTNVADGFVEGDYTRGGATPGLQGDGTSYLDSGRANNADPQNDKHASIYVSVATTSDIAGGRAYLGVGGNDSGAMNILSRQVAPLSIDSRLNNATAAANGNNSAVGFIGINRDSSLNYSARIEATNYTNAAVSQTPQSGNVYLYRLNWATAGLTCNVGLAFYSIGEALDLEALDARVTALVTAIGAAV
jgi:hypothetical protein